MRTWIEQMDLDQLVMECGFVTRSDEVTARDALLDILSYLWTNDEKYNDAFSHPMALRRYLKLSTIRHIVRYHKQANKYQLLSPEELPHGQETPEEQMIALLALQKGAVWIEQAQAELKPQEARATKRMLKHILESPETYIVTRKSGKNTGQYTFNYSKLSQSLKWPRRQVYQRLEALREALLKQASHTDGVQQ